jgi:FlaA1/EpsC-like NDP-sugar epimerase
VNSPQPASPSSAAIDWYPLLQRPALPPALSLTHLRDQCVFVTGAGGSIGSALSIRLAALAPRRLILLDASEQALYRVQALLAKNHSPATTTILGSVNDSALLDEICTQYRPEFVFHAAAHKHAPLLEQQPFAAIATNALGTWTLVKSLQHHHNPRMILLSTDKAVDPTSILGATKRIAELITLAYGGIALRLANVLGSEGSVVETFLHQISAGLPLTITHQHAERFFLTISETVDLLLTAAAPPSSRGLFIPNLDKPHRISTLANFLAETQATTHRIEHVYTGLRPGDKIHESLHSANEFTAPTNLPSLLAVHLFSAEGQDLPRQLSLLTEAVQVRNLPRAMNHLLNLVPTYKPSAEMHRLVDQSRNGVPTP